MRLDGRQGLSLHQNRECFVLFRGNQIAKPRFFRQLRRRLWRQMNFLGGNWNEKKKFNVKTPCGNELSIDILCIFLLWKRGLPRKLFLILVNLVFHNWPPLAGPPCWLALFVTPKWGDAGCTIADCVIWSLSANKFDTIMGPEFARWCTGDAVHDEVVMDRLLLLLAEELEWSVIWAFGRPALV